jgi:L-cysteine/cystine lyase
VSLATKIDVDGVRRDLAVTRRLAYFNTGTAGPWPTPVVEAMLDALQREAELGRASPRGLPGFREVLVSTRQGLARLVGAGPDELALSGSTTLGINIVVWGLEWQPGDEVVTTSIEHHGVLVPLQHLASRRGVFVRMADVGGGGSALDPIVAQLSERTRLVALSHVSFSTGARLPIREIAGAAHAVGAGVLVDGAQSVGAIPVDVHALDVDYYAFPGQKWLFGPEGTGGLYVRETRQAELRPTFVGTRSRQPKAAAYEHGTLFRPGIEGLHAALAWRTAMGDEAIFARTAELAAYLVEQLALVPGVELVTPSDAHAGLVCFRFAGVTDDGALDACVAYLAERGVSLRSVNETRCLRVSCSFFNTEAEIDQLVQLLGRWARDLHLLAPRAEH